MNECKNEEGKFAGAGLIIRSDDHYLVKNVEGRIGILGGKIEKDDHSLFDTASRDAFTDGKIDVQTGKFEIVHTYVVPETRYMVFLIEHEKYKYCGKTFFSRTNEGILEWKTIDEIKEFREKQRDI